MIFHVQCKQHTNNSIPVADHLGLHFRGQCYLSTTVWSRNFLVKTLGSPVLTSHSFKLPTIRTATYDQALPSSSVIYALHILINVNFSPVP